MVRESYRDKAIGGGERALQWNGSMNLEGREGKRWPNEYYYLPVEES